MRGLLAIVILAALGWSGFWYVSASARETAIEEWLADRRDAGWIASIGEIDLRGFPNRVDTVLHDIDIAPKAAGWRWRGDELQIMSLTYRQDHHVLAWPGTHRLDLPTGWLELLAQRLRGSLTFSDPKDLVLESTVLEADGLNIDAPAGWSTYLGHGVIASRLSERTDALPNSHDIGLRFEEIVVPDAVADAAGIADLMPETVPLVTLDATLSLNAAISRSVLERATPDLEAVVIHAAKATWGTLQVEANGDLVADRSGFAEGALNVTAHNWQDMLDIAARAEVISQTMAKTLHSGLGLLAVMSSDGDKLTLPLKFSDGRAKLGPIEIGPAPRLR